MLTNFGSKHILLSMVDTWVCKYIYVYIICINNVSFYCNTIFFRWKSLENYLSQCQAPAQSTRHFPLKCITSNIFPQDKDTKNNYDIK